MNLWMSAAISDNHLPLIKGGNSTMATWREDIATVIQKLGGVADLEAIYKALPPAKKRKGSWQATVRNTLQIHDPDSDSFKGNPTFRNKGWGTWALRNSAKTKATTKTKKKR